LVKSFEDDRKLIHERSLKIVIDRTEV
jgi:hypothetical protein